MLIFAIYPGPSSPYRFHAFLKLFEEQMLKFYNGKIIQRNIIKYIKIDYDIEFQKKKKKDLK